jgi:hypothetical protein
MEAQSSLRCAKWIVSVMWTNFSFEGFNLRAVYFYFRGEKYFDVGQFCTKYRVLLTVSLLYGKIL